MTRTCLSGIILLVASWSAVTPVSAQDTFKFKIEDVRIGFDAARNERDLDTSSQLSNVFKMAQWAPLRFRLKVLGESAAPLQLKITSQDTDGTKTVQMIPLGPLGLNDAPTGPDDQYRTKGSYIEANEFLQTAYVRVPNSDSSVTLAILTNEPEKKPVEVSGTWISSQQNGYLDPLNNSAYVVLGLGSKLSGFELPKSGPAVANNANATDLREQRIHLASVATVQEMPDQWYGYSSVDLVVLATGGASQEFLDELFDPQKSQRNVLKRQALLEWLRRGGRMVISAGVKARLLNQYPAFREFLPISITEVIDIPALRLSFTLPGSPINELLRLKGPDFPQFPICQVATRTDRVPAQTLLPTLRGDGELPPGDHVFVTVVQSALGLGRLTFVGIDIDLAPLRDSTKRPQFWDWLLRKSGSELSTLPPEDQSLTPGIGLVDTEDGVAGAIRREVDHFDSVPVVSFGWVALLILVYMLLIGPIEYIFLKKILGRLEYTWITFPIIVVSVSLLAYFAVYAIKGKDLLINKVDVVDIDLGTQRVYGRTWFTIFSPRPDSYTLGVQPREEWIPSNPDATPSPSLVDWMGGVNPYGSNISRGFREYEYKIHQPDNADAAGNGLINVPIQVWLTKAFQAEWSSVMDPTRLPIEANFKHIPADVRATRGEFTSQLPISRIEKGLIFYAGQAYPLETMLPGVPMTFNSTSAPYRDWKSEVALTDSKFYSEDNSPDQQVGRNQRYLANANTGPLSFWGVLFHEEGLRESRGMLQNSSWRMLDQSWRLSERNIDEVILAFQLPKQVGPAETVFSDANSTAPTRLWLNGLPFPNATPLPTPGIVHQDTYVRIYIPIQNKR